MDGGSTTPRSALHRRDSAVDPRFLRSEVIGGAHRPPPLPSVERGLPNMCGPTATARSK